MANYKIVSHGGSGLPLNVYGSGTITSRRNVCIWTDTGSTDQQWAIASLGSNQQVKSLNNLNYMLNANTPRLGTAMSTPPTLIPISISFWYPQVFTVCS